MNGRFGKWIDGVRQRHAGAVKSPARCAAEGTNACTDLRLAAIAQALIGAEYEDLVLNDRPACRGAELILLQRRYAR